MLHQYWSTSFHRDEDVRDILLFVKQADTAHHVGLISALDAIASHIDAAFPHSFIHIQWGQVVVHQFGWIHLVFIYSLLSTKAHHIGHARYGHQLTYDEQVLYGGDLI